MRFKKSLLEDYKKLNDKIKALEKQRAEIKDVLIQKGDYEADGLKLQVIEIDVERITDKDGLIEKFGRRALSKFLKQYTQFRVMVKEVK